jgi:hypothetical protein
MRRGAAWNVTRTGGTVRLEVNSVGHLSEADADAMVVATEELLGDEEINSVQVDGPALSDRPPKGLTRALRELDRLTRRHGIRLMVGPI